MSINRFIFYIDNIVLVKIARVLCPLGTSGRTFLVLMSTGCDDGPWSTPRYSVCANSTRLCVIKTAPKSDRKLSLALEREHKMYTELKHIQGVIIPEVYGFFCGFSEQDPNKEYWGIPMEFCLPTEDFVPDASFESKIINGIRAIHAAGYSHRNLLNLNHIVVHENSPRFISLSKVHSGHVCPEVIYNGPDGNPIKPTKCCSELAAIHDTYMIRRSTAIESQEDTDSS